MIVAVLSRHAGLSLGGADVFVNVAGGVRIDEPGADLAIALAIASAARNEPLRPGTASFGEIGLTGRLRPAAQAERRAQECAKLGLDLRARARRHGSTGENRARPGRHPSSGGLCSTRKDQDPGRVVPSEQGFLRQKGEKVAFSSNF